MAERIPRAKSGRWYIREVDDPIDSVPDLSPAQQGMVDAKQIIDPEPED